MEIGPLSEWVTAAAEIAAVCVALFLPFYEKVREKRRKMRNLKLIFSYLIKKALAEQETGNLESYLKISYLASDDGDEQIYSIAQQALTILQNQDMPQEKKEEEIHQILKYLK